MRYVCSDLVLSRLYSHRGEQVKMATISKGYKRKGHEERVVSLDRTIEQIKNGHSCNRAVAQLFAAGYRMIKKEQK